MLYKMYLKTQSVSFYEYGGGIEKNLRYACVCVALRKTGAYQIPAIPQINLDVTYKNI